MVLNGFQKLTLLDFPGHTAATLFTAGCNFRCPFCHNASLVTDLSENETFNPEDILSFLEKRKGILDGIAITGGEPTLHPDLPDLIRDIKKMGYQVKLDSNGTNPTMLINLFENGLIDYLAMDIKNCPEKYAETVGLHHIDLDPINESISYLLSHQYEYEFRTTVVKELHQPDDFEKIGQWINGASRYYLQHFVDSGNLIGAGMSACDYAEMKKMKEKVLPFVKTVEIRGISE